MTSQVETNAASNGPRTLEHMHDGIQEYDNPLPGWWKNIFVATLIFAPAYMLVFSTGGPGSTIEEKYAIANGENTTKKYKTIGEVEWSEANMVNYLQDPQWVAVGASIFKSNCVSCHGADGGGKIGPNLCDENYKHIKALPDIIKVINEGVGAGAMPAWGTRFGHKNDVLMVSIYVASLRGSKPAEPKAPDGSPIPAWPKPEVNK